MNYVKAFESYRLTDKQADRQTQPKLYTTRLCGWSAPKKQKNTCENISFLGM